MTRGKYEETVAALQAQWAVLVPALAELDPTGPTDCEGWTVADLETHLALTTRSLGRIAGEPSAGDSEGGVLLWMSRLEALSGVADEQARGPRLALADEVATTLRALEGTAPDQVVTQVTGRHALADAVLFRLIEGVVHGLDAQVAPDRSALKVVVKELTRAFADLHPGKTVEVRVPPHAAVQCLEGPRHTRGTPPNVVEAEPVAWVRLCAGRDPWSALVSSGRVRASGERSDLSGFLPLLH